LVSSNDIRAERTPAVTPVTGLKVSISLKLKLNRKRYPAYMDRPTISKSRIIIIHLGRIVSLLINRANKSVRFRLSTQGMQI
jgi:hypothetical protein